MVERVDIYNLRTGVIGFGDGVKVPNSGGRCLKNFPADKLDEGAWRLAEGDKPFIAIVKAGSAPPAAAKAAAEVEKPKVENVVPEPPPEAKEVHPDWESPERTESEEPVVETRGKTADEILAGQGEVALAEAEVPEPTVPEEVKEAEEEKEDESGGEEQSSLPDSLPDESWGSVALIKYVQEKKIKVSGSRTKANMLIAIRKYHGVE
jgi:hypothetical protein